MSLFALPISAQPLAVLAVAGLWQGLLLLGSVALLLRVLPTGSASVRAALWSAAFGLAVLVPFVHLHAVTGTSTATSPALHLGPFAEVAIVLLWLALSLFRAARLLRQVVRLRRISRISTAFTAPAALLPLLHVGRRTLELRSSSAVDSPCVLGFFRPRLLLPAGATLSPADLHAVILHEREHLLRHDDWTNLLQRLALILFPLNPALALIDRQLDAERELACDAAVVARTAEPLRYAGILTRLAEQRLHLRSVALSLSGWARRSALTRRVETLLRPAASISPRQSRFAAATAAVALCAGSAALARAPQLVSFAGPSSPATAVAAALPTTGFSAHALPAAYHPGAAHAVLLRATLPSTSAVPARAVHRRATAGHVHRAGTYHANTPAAPRAILTAARSSATLRTSATPAAGVRTIVFTNDLPSYAAVPFAGGWLVIQL